MSILTKFDGTVAAGCCFLRTLAPSVKSTIFYRHDVKNKMFYHNAESCKLK